jgi:hypothetical protein
LTENYNKSISDVYKETDFYKLLEVE